MIGDIREVNFPEYATLSQATCTLQDMAEHIITTQVRIDGDIAPDFSYDWEVIFKGNKYIHPLRQPQAAKENTTLNSVIDLTFHHWAVYELKRWMFFTVQSVESGTAVADKYIASVSLDIVHFCNLLGSVLQYYYGNKITIDLKKRKYDTEPKVVEISYSYIWDVLIKFHELFGQRWYIEPNGSADKYVIKIGYDAKEIGHIFEYGFEGGLLKVERQVQNDNIRNMLLGRGGDKNIPYRYFKDTDPDNPSFSADPDWIPELANIYFDRLRGATFRSYVQGWKARHYGGTVTKAQSYAPWAWELGNTDERFNPVEYVKDDVSIKRYGPLQGGLEDNDDFFPTIQGRSVGSIGLIDEAVDVEQVISDDVETAVENDASISDTITKGRATAKEVHSGAYATVPTIVGEFTVPAKMRANFIDDTQILSVTRKGSLLGNYERGENIAESAELISTTVVVIDRATGQERSASGIPEGKYRYEITARIHNISDHALNISVGVSAPKLISASGQSEGWGNTFDIWVKNIWGTAIQPGEEPEAYAQRVWIPILGDRKSNEAKVVFSDGWLATSQDYEFTIVGIPAYDTDKSLNGVPSEWRITLAKSDADLKATGLYVPSTMRNGAPGDHFFFTGIELPHLYVRLAEEALDDHKSDQLIEVSDIKPSWVVSLDKIRISHLDIPDPDSKAYLALEKLGLFFTEDGGKVKLDRSGLVALIDVLRPGNIITLFDKRFIEGSHQEKLYVQSLTLTYNEPTSDNAALIPDVEVVLSDRYENVANPVATLQGDVSSISRVLGSISNVEQIVRAVGDKLYLRKDGMPDRSMSPTEFASLLTSLGFRSGIVGGAGWGIYKDESGNWVIEADCFKARQDFEVNNLVVNQIVGRGGMIVESAAQMEVTQVVETAKEYVCYFDQKEGTVANLFRKGDVAYCNRFTPENNDLKFYKRRVMEVSPNSITLTKGYEPVELPDGTMDTGVNGSGVPEVGDAIIHAGSYDIPERRYIKVRDVMGGGYERYIEGLDSVNASGTEYYFVGRQAGMYNGRPRWYIGDKNGYIEYVNGVLNIKGRIDMRSTIGDKTIDDYFKEQIGDIATILVEYSRTPAPMDDKEAWHSTYDPEDRYMRQSTDNGKTWEGPIRIGAVDGKDGQYRMWQWAKNMSTTKEPEGGWQNTPVTALPGEYVWMRSGVVVPPAITPTQWETAVRLTGDKGADGQSTYLLDLSNEVEGVACDVDGNPTGPLPSTELAVYKGGSVDSGWIFSKTDDGCTSAFTSGNILEVKTLSAAVNTATVTVTATKVGYPTLTAVMNIYKVLPGKDGEDGMAATVFSLLPSVNSVTRHADGSLSANAVTCTVLKTTGDALPMGSNQHTLSYQRLPDGATGILTRSNGVSQPVQILPKTEAVIFELKNGNTTLDRERVPVLTDVESFSEGGKNLILNSGFNSYANWDAPKYDITLDVTDKFDGSNVVKIVTSGYGSNQWRGFWQRYPDNPHFKCEPDTYYSFSIWSYTPDRAALDGAHFDIYVHDSNGVRLMAKSTAIELTANGVWQQFKGTFKTPATAHHFNIEFWSLRNGDVWFSKPQLVRGAFLPDWAPSPYDFDYISEALKNGERMDLGLLLGSLINVGHNDENGNFKVMGGINGITKDSSGRDIAFWAGGDMVDAEDAGGNITGAATAVIRHDGTAYFASNVIRLLKESVMLGDDVALDREGLKLMVDGDVRAIMHNKPVEVDFDKLASNVRQIGKRTPAETVEVPMSMLGTFRMAISKTVTKTYDLGFVTAGSTGSCRIGISAMYPFTGAHPTKGIWPISTLARAELRRGSTVVATFNLTTSSTVRYNSDLPGNKTDGSITYSISENISFTCPTEETYTLAIVFPETSSAMDGSSAGTLDCAVRVYGTIKLGLGNQTVIGNDGFASSWDESAIAVNKEAVILRSGLYGVMLDPTKGIRATLNGGQLWFTLKLSGGQLIFTTS